MAAIDGKHVMKQQQRNGGSLQLKAHASNQFPGNSSTELRVFVDDGEAWKKSTGINVLSLTALLSFTRWGDVLFVLVGDGAFVLKTYLQKSYPSQNLPLEKKRV